MHIFSLRRIFRALHGVKYSTCENCGEPISSTSSLHACNPESIPLSFTYTKLTESSRSVHFYDRMPGRSFLHEVKVWANNYICGIELTIEDLQNKKIQRVRRGEAAGKTYRFVLENGEFINKIEYGCDFHGMYYLMLSSQKVNIEIGDPNRPKKNIKFPEGSGLVGLFGGHNEIILHLGFYFDSCAEVNWKRHRELLLIRTKGSPGQNNTLGFILKLDDHLLRYLATFL
jgi:hypothetical protein